MKQGAEATYIGSGGMIFVTVHNKVRFDQKAKQRVRTIRIVVVKQYQFQNPRQVFVRIVCLFQKVTHQMGRFPLLVCLTGIPGIVRFTVLYGNVVQNGCRLQNLSVPFRESFLLAQQLGQGINFQDVLCTSGMPLFITQCMVQQFGFVMAQAADTPFPQ